MALVSYSDSEGSENETSPPPPKIVQSPTPPKPSSQQLTNKSQPRKIQVSLTESTAEPAQQNGEIGEPPAKRTRVGASTFSGFNAMLPPPKRTGAAATQSSSNKGPPRKIFSLKTGPEPGFDRSADTELTQLFRDEEHGTHSASSEGETTRLPRPQSSSTTATATATAAEPPKIGNAMMFKPLSVARNPQKKKQAANTIKSGATQQSTQTSSIKELPNPPVSAPRVNLFSLQNDVENESLGLEKSNDYEPIVYQGPEGLKELNDDDDEEGYIQDYTDNTAAGRPPDPSPTGQTLDTIANDLNLSASAKRQLFGRNGTKLAINAVNVVNFNTDEEYAANESFRANGDQAQHNPVRAIAPGKHSLRQLVTAASNQRDALEESFASGRRNKKEAGSKYGW